VSALHRPAMALSVTVQSASRLLRIEWDDDTVSALTHGLLRARCRCAACTRLMRDGQAPAVAADVALTDVHAVGDTGLNLVFSDGHGRGIYPWPYLHALGTEAAGR
jgi:DUF971 family protein